jgi:signal transduction histidine kinase
MILQISPFTIFTNVSGMVLFPISFWITVCIIRLVSNKKTKMEWTIIAAIIVILLGSDILSTVLDLTAGSTGTAPLANLFYLIGSIFVIMVVLVSYHATREISRDERSLLKLNSDLASRIEAGERSLEETREKMLRQDKLATIGKLAGSVSHELRNPLGVISNSIYYLKTIVKISDERVQKHLDLIKEQAERANKVIKDLLDFARTKPEEPALIEIPQLVQQALDLVQKPENIEVTTSLDSSLPKLVLDPLKMQQVFQNIISNAYQAMPNGGSFQVTAVRNDKTVEIAFKDTGEGISNENLPKLFEPLFSTKINGTGLGLVIAKEIIEYYHGKIEVASSLGIGTTFTITLPVRESKIVVQTLSESFW